MCFSFNSTLKKKKILVLPYHYHRALRIKYILNDSLTFVGNDWYSENQEILCTHNVDEITKTFSWDKHENRLFHLDKILPRIK